MSIVAIGMHFVVRVLKTGSNHDFAIRFTSGGNNGNYIAIKGTYRDHRVTGALNFHKTRDFGILVMVLDV